MKKLFSPSSVTAHHRNVMVSGISSVMFAPVGSECSIYAFLEEWKERRRDEWKKV
jgi:hypothetical protein